MDYRQMYLDHVEGDREFLRLVAAAFGIREDEVTHAFLERQAACRPVAEPKPQSEQREEWRLRNLMPGGKPGPITDMPPDPRHTLGCAIEHRTITTTPWSHYPKDGK